MNVPSTKHPLRIGIVAPSTVTRRSGNAHTATRYARFLRSAGHRVTLLPQWHGEPLDLLIALHARKSAGSALAFARDRAEGRLLVVLTGTDVYRDLARSKRAWLALEAADAIVTLQPAALRRLPPRLRARARAIVQSARAAYTRPAGGGPLRACVIGHLRTEKDPLRAAYALQRLPNAPIAVTQAGAAIDGAFAQRAHALAGKDSRYRWIGDISHARALRLLAHSDVLVLSSRMEGGANVLSEAIAAGVPAIASRIDGNVGVLGADYPAYFPVGNTERCARLLERCAEDPRFLASLRNRVRRLQPLVRPERERAEVLAAVRAAISRR